MEKDLHVAFVGNPNCGKTSLFNAYTGAKLKVANWPGVTVEKKEGALAYHDNVFKLVDLLNHHLILSDNLFGLDLHQIVNIETITLIRRNTSCRCMRL